MATAAHMYNEMNFENHLMNQAYLHPGNSLGKFRIINRGYPAIFAYAGLGRRTVRTSMVKLI